MDYFFLQRLPVSANPGSKGDSIGGVGAPAGIEAAGVGDIDEGGVHAVSAVLLRGFRIKIPVQLLTDALRSQQAEIQQGPVRLIEFFHGIKR